MRKMDIIPPAGGESRVVHIFYRTRHSFSKSKVMNQNPLRSSGVKGPWARDDVTASLPHTKLNREPLRCVRAQPKT